MFHDARQCSLRAVKSATSAALTGRYDMAEESRIQVNGPEDMLLFGDNFAVLEMFVSIILHTERMMEDHVVHAPARW